MTTLSSFVKKKKTKMTSIQQQAGSINNNNNNNNHASPIVEQGNIPGSDDASSFLEQLPSRAANAFGGKSTKTMSSFTAVVSMVVIGVLLFDACSGVVVVVGNL